MYLLYYGVYPPIVKDVGKGGSAGGRAGAGGRPKPAVLSAVGTRVPELRCLCSLVGVTGSSVQAWVLLCTPLCSSSGYRLLERHDETSR